MMTSKPADKEKNDFLDVFRWLLVLPLVLTAYVATFFASNSWLESLPPNNFWAQHIYAVNGFLSFLAYMLVGVAVVPNRRLVIAAVLACYPVYVCIAPLFAPPMVGGKPIPQTELIAAAAVTLPPMLVIYALLAHKIIRRLQKRSEKTVSVHESTAAAERWDRLYFALWTPIGTLISLLVMAMVSSFLPRIFAVIPCVACLLGLAGYIYRRQEVLRTESLPNLATPVLNLYAWIFFWATALVGVRFTDPTAELVRSSLYCLFPMLLAIDIMQWPGAKARKITALCVLGVIAAPIYLLAGCNVIGSSIFPEQHDEIKIGNHRLEKVWHSGFNGNGWQMLYEKRLVCPGIEYWRELASNASVEVQQIDSDTVKVTVGKYSAPTEELKVHLHK